MEEKHVGVKISSFKIIQSRKKMGDSPEPVVVVNKYFNLKLQVIGLSDLMIRILPGKLLIKILMTMKVSSQ